MLSNKEVYIQLQQTYNDFPVFMRDWWLQAVCAGKEWDVLLSYDAEGKIRAVLPYLLRKRLWMRYVLMPQQTQLGGIWIRPDLRDDVETTQSICEEFADQLRRLKLSYYYQQYMAGSLCPSVMQKLGFRIRERVTYRIENLHDLDVILSKFSKNKKRQLQKALTLHTDWDMSVEQFYQFHERCLTKQGKKISYTREFLLVLYQKAKRKGQCQILRICDQQNDVLAAVLLVWDEETMYYLIPCYDVDYKDSGAGALLVWESIKFAQSKVQHFDFEGSMIRGVANHYKQFGSTALKYYSVEKYYHPMFAIALFVNWLRNIKKR